MNLYLDRAFPWRQINARQYTLISAFFYYDFCVLSSQPSYCSTLFILILMCLYSYVNTNSFVLYAHPSPITLTSSLMYLTLLKLSRRILRISLCLLLFSNITFLYHDIMSSLNIRIPFCIHITSKSLFVSYFQTARKIYPHNSKRYPLSRPLFSSQVVQVTQVYISSLALQPRLSFLLAMSAPMIAISSLLYHG